MGINKENPTQSDTLKKLYGQAIEALDNKENEIYSIHDLLCYLPCSKSTFYNKFNSDSEELDDIKKRIDSNKIKIKKKLRKIFMDFTTSSPAERIFLYKLLSNDEERKALSRYDMADSAPEPIKHNIILTHCPESDT